RVVVDGKPAGEQKLEWALETMNEGVRMSSAESDGQGVVRIGRDPFADRTNRVTSVRVSAPNLTATGDVWFDAGVDPPANLDTVSTLSVRTGALTVVVPRALMADVEGRPAVLRLLAEV